MTTTSALTDTGLLAPPPQRKPNDELGQSDFLKLMITQFRNQDPFKPMENGDFLAQLAQFSTVNGIESLNSAFSGLASSIRGEQALQAANLVGRTVMGVSDSGYLAADGSLDGLVELSASAGTVQIDIVDEQGALLRTLDLGQQPAGLTRFSWDGRDADGDRVAAGHYRIEARVVRGSEVESTVTAIESRIESVTLGQFGNEMSLNLVGGGAMSLSQIYQIT